MVRVGVGQFPAEVFAKEANTERIWRLIDQAAAKGVQLLVLPEYSQLGAVPGKGGQETKARMLELAEEAGGPFVSALAERAVRHGMYIYAGTHERVPGEEKLYNTGVFVGPTGAPVYYRKMHLYKTPSWDEQYYYGLGPGYQLVDTPLGRIGLLICYDITFPENARALTLMGAQILLVPAAWPREGRLRWQRLLPARAVENQVFLLGCGMSGETLNGQSLVADYQGNILAELGEEEGVAVADIDLEGQRVWRETTLPYLRDRRPDQYQILSDPTWRFDSILK